MSTVTRNAPGEFKIRAYELRRHDEVAGFEGGIHGQDPIVIRQNSIEHRHDDNHEEPPGTGATKFILRPRASEPGGPGSSRVLGTERPVR
jgi:hypothetical protein